MKPLLSSVSNQPAVITKLVLDHGANPNSAVDERAEICLPYDKLWSGCTALMLASILHDDELSNFCYPMVLE